MAVSMNDSGSRSGSSPEKGTEKEERKKEEEENRGKEERGKGNEEEEEEGEVKNGTDSEDSERKSRSSDRSTSQSSRSRERKKSKKSKKKKHKKSYPTDKRSPVKKRHRSTNSERSRSRDKKKKRKYSRSSRSSSRHRSRHARRRSSSQTSSSPKRRKSRSRSRDRKRKDHRSTDHHSSRRRRSRSGSRSRRYSRNSRPSRSPRRDRYKSRDSRTSHVSTSSMSNKIDLAKLIRLPGGSTFKKELNEEEQIKKELENFQSKNNVTTENGVHEDLSPTKKKHTIADFFDSSEADDDFSSRLSKSKKRINYGSFNFAPLSGSSGTSTNHSSWKGGWVKTEVQSNTNGLTPPIAPPRLTRAPHFAIDDESSNVSSPASGMPTLTRRPDSSNNSTPVKPEIKPETNGIKPEAPEPEPEPIPEVKDELQGGAYIIPPVYNPSNPLSDDDMEMDISDSDDYDDEEVNKSTIPPNEPISDEENGIKMEPVQKQTTPEPPPLRHRPPPPMRGRPSRFSSAPVISSPAPPPLERAPLWMDEPAPSTPPDAQPLEIPKFDKIKESIYLCNKDLVRAGKDTRKMECDCSLPDDPGEPACGDDCLNRNVMIECSNRCKCADKCTNKNFQKRRYSDLEVFWTNGKGHGLRATGPISRGNFIIEYMGEVVSAKDFKKRSHEYARAEKKHHYFMELNKNATIDASQKGAISRFINHSCEPNAETQKWTVNGILRIGFFALRDIEVGEEVTFDYQFIHFGVGQQCLCGKPSCIGIIGRKAGIDEYRKKAGVKNMQDENFSKQILGMKRLDCQEDMQNLTRIMSLTSSKDIPARKKALTFVMEASKDLQRIFISLFGLEILFAYAKEDDLEENQLKPQILQCLSNVPVATRDKVEDCGLLSIIEKWAKVDDEHSGLANELSQKWKKCMRRIPLKEVAKTDPDPTPPAKPPPLLQMATLRRSPRLRPEKEPEIDPEVRAQLRQEHRRKFERNLAQEEELKTNIKICIDDRLRAALEEDSGSEKCSPPPSDAPSPDDLDEPADGPHTPISYLQSPNTWTPEKQKNIANGLCEVYKPLEGDEQLPIGFGTIISRLNGANKKDGKCLVLFTLEEIEHLKAFVELARIGLELKDKKREERERRERDQKRKMAEEEKRKAAKKAAEEKAAAAAAAAAAEDGGKSNSNSIPNGTKSDSVPEQMLPDNWATAKDGEGNIYYYNVITRETSWDPPKMNQKEEDEKNNKLRRLLERHIGDLLLSYRDPEAHRGRITNDDDYRYLIKRLSFGLVKRIVGELKTYRMNEKAKTMAAKYCHKYMIRQGAIYIRKKVSQLPRVVS